MATKKLDPVQDVFDVLNNHSITTSKEATRICIDAIKIIVECEVRGEAEDFMAAIEKQAAAEKQREADAKTMDRATYRRKHGCVAEPPKAGK